MRADWEEKEIAHQNSDRRSKRTRRRRTPARRRYRRQLLLAIAAFAMLTALLLLISRFADVLGAEQVSGLSEQTSGVFSRPASNGSPSTPAATPDYVVQDLLPVNEYSRPGTPLEAVNGIVVHYVGNPNTTAEQNRSYFAGFADSHATYASSHFIIGIDGTIIQCVPLDEIAYCSNSRNEDTISIECCHPGQDGEFSEQTLKSLKKLLRWLVEVYDLPEESLIRHYDVTGKECPKYYVDHPEAWQALKDEVFSQ